MWESWPEHNAETLEQLAFHDVASFPFPNFCSEEQACILLGNKHGLLNPLRGIVFILSHTTDLLVKVLFPAKHFEELEVLEDLGNESHSLVLHVNSFPFH